MPDDQNPYESLSTSDSATQKKDRLPIGIHLLCGWPLLLIFVGGAIGGGLGGAAYAINVSIYKSELSAKTKALLIAVTGMAAIGIWFWIAMVIHLIWQ